MCRRLKTKDKHCARMSEDWRPIRVSHSHRIPASCLFPTYCMDTGAPQHAFSEAPLTPERGPTATGTAASRGSCPHKRTSKKMRYQKNSRSLGGPRSHKMCWKEHRNPERAPRTHTRPRDATAQRIQTQRENTQTYTHTRHRRLETTELFGTSLPTSFQTHPDFRQPYAECVFENRSWGRCSW